MSCCHWGPAKRPNEPHYSWQKYHCYLIYNSRLSLICYTTLYITFLLHPRAVGKCMLSPTWHQLYVQFFPAAYESESLQTSKKDLNLLFPVASVFFKRCWTWPEVIHHLSRQNNNSMQLLLLHVSWITQRGIFTFAVFFSLRRGFIPRFLPPFSVWEWF